MSTVIIGGGIIGLSTAYYLSLEAEPSPGRSRRAIHLVESAPAFFLSASGRAGGFLARDWFGPATTDLGALSFDLHRSLAAAHNGREEWGYAGSTSLSLSSTGATGKRGHDWLLSGTSRADAVSSETIRFASERDKDWPCWLVLGDGDQCEVISTSSSTAQLDPHRFCQWLLKRCQEQGVVVHHPAKPTRVINSPEGYLTALELELASEITTVPCDQLVITAGAWTSHVFKQLFPSASPKASTALRVFPLSGHSLVLRSKRWAVQERELAGNAGDCHGVYTTDPTGFSPEMYSRLSNPRDAEGDGELWLGGFNSSTLPLPTLAGGDTPDAAAIDALSKVARRMLGDPEQNAWTIKRASLCHRPVTSNGVPLLDRIPDRLLGGEAKGNEEQGGVWVCAGHGPWGISLSLGSGKVLAEMLCGRQPSIDVARLRLSL